MKIRPFKICLWLSILTILAGLPAPGPLAAADPAVTTAAATNENDNSATLNGNLTALGDIGTVYVYFEYGTTEGGPYQETDHQEMSATGPFQAVINDLSPETTYYYRAVAEVDGTEFAGTEMSFTTDPDTTPPRVNSNSPAHEATDVPINTTIAVNFDEAMDQTATQGAFSIDPLVAGSFSWNETEMTFDPDADLAYSQTYQVTISTEATDLTGNSLEAEHTFPFTTETDTAPEVVGKSPDNGAVDVPVTTVITITFSEPMDQESAEEAFSINPDAAGSFSWDEPGGTEMTFTSDAGSNLAYSQTYQVTISTEATDLTGNSLEAEHTFSFTTETDTAPEVVGKSPDNGAVDVPVTTVITITFSEPMNQDTTEEAFSIDPDAARYIRLEWDRDDLYP
jgi:hypothetical protein